MDPENRKGTGLAAGRKGEEFLDPSLEDEGFAPLAGIPEFREILELKQHEGRSSSSSSSARYAGPSDLSANRDKVVNHRGGAAPSPAVPPPLPVAETDEAKGQVGKAGRAREREKARATTDPETSTKRAKKASSPRAKVRRGKVERGEKEKAREKARAEADLYQTLAKSNVRTAEVMDTINLTAPEIT